MGIFERLFGKKETEQERSGGQEGPVCRILCTEGCYIGQTFELRDGDEIGRHPNCAIVLQDRMVARRHCTFIYSGEEWYIVCSGLYGTVIDGELYHDAVDAVPLRPGSKIRIMDNEFEVE